MYKLRINPLARQDLLDIKDYLTNELDNPTDSTNVVSRITESYEKLEEFPMLGIELSSKSCYNNEIQNRKEALIWLNLPLAKALPVR